MLFCRFCRLGRHYEVCTGVVEGQAGEEWGMDKECKRPPRRGRRWTSLKSRRLNSFEDLGAPGTSLWLSKALWRLSLKMLDRTPRSTKRGEGGVVTCTIGSCCSCGQQRRGKIVQPVDWLRLCQRASSLDA